MNALQHLRKQHGERQEEIAALLGMSAANLSGYERGTRPLTEEHINLLCDHFGVSADTLLGREIPDKSPLPDNLRADLIYQLPEEVPGLNAHAGDIALVECKASRKHIPSDCYVLVDTPEGRGLRHYIRQPGVELLYNKDDRAEVWTLNGEEMLDITFLGYVTYILHSV